MYREGQGVGGAGGEGASAIHQSTSACVLEVTYPRFSLRAAKRACVARSRSVRRRHRRGCVSVSSLRCLTCYNAERAVASEESAGTHTFIYHRSASGSFAVAFPSISLTRTSSSPQSRACSSPSGLTTGRGGIWCVAVLQGVCEVVHAFPPSPDHSPRRAAPPPLLHLRSRPSMSTPFRPLR